MMCAFFFSKEQMPSVICTIGGVLCTLCLLICFQLCFSSVSYLGLIFFLRKLTRILFFSRKKVKKKKEKKNFHSILKKSQFSYKDNASGNKIGIF